MIEFILVALFVSLSCLLLWFIVAPKKWKHDQVGWGYPTNRSGGDTFQPKFDCEFCDRQVTQDSQLNWFHIN